MSILVICDIVAICLIYLRNATHLLTSKGTEGLSLEMTRKGGSWGGRKRAWFSGDRKGQEAAESWRLQ